MGAAFPRCQNSLGLTPQRPLASRSLEKFGVPSWGAQWFRVQDLQLIFGVPILLFTVRPFSGVGVLLGPFKDVGDRAIWGYLGLSSKWSLTC